MNRTINIKTITILMIFSYVSLFGGCGGFGSSEDESEATPTAQVTISFSGSGDDMTKDFYVHGGRVTFEARHSGEGAFSATLKSRDSGEGVGVIGYGSGDYEKKTYVDPSVGWYYIEVEGYGGWSVSASGNISLKEESETTITVLIKKFVVPPLGGIHLGIFTCLSAGNS